MTKRTSFFSHDSNARNDNKMIAIRMRHKSAGYAVYFMILERLRDEADYMSIKDYNVLAFDFRESAEVVKSVVEDFGLFEFTEDGKKFFSVSFMERMDIKDEQIRIFSESGKKGGGNPNFKKGESNPYYQKDKGIDKPPLCDEINKKSKVSKEEDPPITPQGDESEPPVWKKDFKIYLNELRIEFKQLVSEKEWISQQEKFNPGVDIQKSIEKSCVNYWATEAGWKKKKGSKIKSIDWKSTFANAVSRPTNRVYKEPPGFKKEESKQKINVPAI